MYSNWKLENKAVLNHVVCRALDAPISVKQNSDYYCGVFVDARPRALGLVEEYASFRAFKAYSKSNYPIFALINENYAKDFLNEKLIKDWRITLIPIKNLDCSKNLNAYSQFMIKEMPHLIPSEFKRALFWQADGFLLNTGWEDFIEHSEPYFLGAPTRHVSRVCVEGSPDSVNLGFINMNGGFSYRRLDMLRELSQKWGHINCYEYGREDKQAPPEDQWYNFMIAANYPERYPKMEDAALFAQDPLKSINDINKTYGFHSCQT